MDADSNLAYRRALGTFATGVCVVTAEREGRALGLTVNSFTSVSLDPALVLWCLDEDSDRFHVFAEADAWAVNILTADDRDHSERFAWGAAELTPDERETGACGAPLLKGALTRLDCSTHDRIRLGDHLVVVGRVERFETGEGDALVFFRGGYGRTGAGEGL